MPPLMPEMNRARIAISLRARNEFTGVCRVNFDLISI
jgi:hypothetical protein